MKESDNTIHRELIKAAYAYGEASYQQGGFGDPEYNQAASDRREETWEKLSALISEAVYGKGKYD